jgi:type IV secretion system protein VirD4
MAFNNVHGSAHWMTPAEAAAVGLDDPAGVVLGQRSNGQLIRFNGDGHLMVFAPTGAGKGIGFVQPNLVEYRGSMVVLDPKGENTIVGAAERRRMGQRVMVLDPFGMTDQQSDTYNPLGALTYADGGNVGPWIECLADALIPSQSEKDKHWTDGAKKFVVFLMWWLVAHEPPAKRNLVRFYELASGGRDLIYKIATVMSEGRSPDANIARECRAKGNWYLDREERELSYFESVGSNYFGWIGDAVWAGVLGGPPSPPLPLKTLEKGMTIFLVLPFHRMERYQSWLRLMVADLLATLYETQGAPKIPVLFLLDEAYAGLGRMPTLTKAAAGVRSAGARLCFIYQDVEQVNELYGNTWQTFISNSGVTLFWSVNDLKAAQFISTRCGQKTTPVPGNPVGMAEPLMRVEALSTLPADEVIALFRNSSPAKFGRLNVRTDTRFSSKLAPNKTYGVPVEKAYTARTDFVAVDLDAVNVKKRRSDPDEEFETTSAPIAHDRSAIADISDRTGLPKKILEQLQSQFGPLILRGAELGYLNERGTFEALMSAGD